MRHPLRVAAVSAVRCRVQFLSKSSQHTNPHEDRDAGRYSPDTSVQPQLAKYLRDPVCGMGVAPSTAPYRVEHGRTSTYFCSERCRSKFLASPDLYLKPVESNWAERRTTAALFQHCARHLHLPDASADPPQCTRELSDLRHDARAARGHPRPGAGPELRRPDATHVDRCDVGGPLVILEMAGHVAGMGCTATSLHHPMWIQFALDRRSCYGPVGRSSSAERRPCAPLAQHVQPDTLGVGAAYLYSLAASFAPGLFPASLKQKDGLDSRSTTKRPPSLLYSCSWGRCSSCGRASARAAPFALCSTSPRRPRGAFMRMVKTKKSHSIRCRSVIASACVRVRACR